MAALSIRDLDDGVRDRLRLRAAQNGRSMEAEVREILSEAVEPPKPEGDWFDALMALADEFGGIELDIPPREFDDRVVEFD